MHIEHLIVKNFRALEDVECSFNRRVNVIVAPNAAGKTTVLQAIRLAKALLAPRTQSEAQQTLISLGAMSPHFPQKLYGAALARDPAKPVEIRLTVCLNAEEISKLQSSKAALIRDLAVSRLGVTFPNPAALIGFMASSQGEEAIRAADPDWSEFLDRLKVGDPCVIGLTLDPASGTLVPIQPLGCLAFAFLDRTLPPHTTTFSYFPADRALPVGEVNIQLGGGDAMAQAESHNSQPQIKYARLKNLIFNQLLLNVANQAPLKDEFAIIFEGLLRSRQLDHFEINELGLLSVITKETGTGRLIELDSLSSGEKNIILVFLHIATCVVNGGIVLLDEPELHLNPAVCKQLIEFIIKQYAKRKSIQFILSTHSPDVLSYAFDHDEVDLFHIRSPKNISKVGRRDYDEFEDALQKLGTSVSESLLYDGQILVEGPTDVGFLQDAFPGLLRKYIIKHRGGRKALEKVANELKDTECSETDITPIMIIIDHDGAPLRITPSENVRILQWDRRCVENYMIDTEVLTALSREEHIFNANPSNAGDIEKLLKEVAWQQLWEKAAREIYSEFAFKSPKFKTEDFEGKDPDQVTAALYSRMSSARLSIPDTPEPVWAAAFVTNVNQRRAEIELRWESRWKEQCDGKRLFLDLQQGGHLKLSAALLKRKITSRMRDGETDNFMRVREQLCQLLNVATK